MHCQIDGKINKGQEYREVRRQKKDKWMEGGTERSSHSRCEGWLNMKKSKQDKKQKDKNISVNGIRQ